MKLKRSQKCGRSEAALAERYSERGSYVVEFSLLMPVFLALLLGTFDVGRAYFEQHVLLEAAHKGARLASLPDVSEAEVRTDVEDYLVSLGIGDALIELDNAGSNGNVGQTVRVDISRAFEPLFGDLVPSLAGWDGIVTLSQTATSRHE